MGSEEVWEGVDAAAEAVTSMEPASWVPWVVRLIFLLEIECEKLYPGAAVLFLKSLTTATYDRLVARGG